MDHVTNSLLPTAFAGQDDQFARAFAVLQSGIEQRAFPGATVAITHQGKLIAHKALGRFTYSRWSRKVRLYTVYDLASISKAFATTTICMLLHERGTFHLEQPLIDILPEFEAEDSRRRHVTLRMLLAHSSGLPAYARLYESAANRQELIEQALRVPLRADPGARAEYSDIGFILLGVALERIVGSPLDRFFKENIYKPLGLGVASYNLPRKPWRVLSSPTQDDRTFRHRIIQGEVNDENAWVMGGVAGHAGLFSTAGDLALFAECMLRGGAPLLDLHTVELFTRREATPTGTSWALGWDTPSLPSQSGRYFSPGSYGHLGFTGTSLWIDPERHLSVTLLTNRTWPDRSSQGIKHIRPAFHDAVIEALQ